MITLLEPRPILLATGLLYITMSLAVLALLYRRHTRLHVVVWCAIGLSMGLAACLFALRGVAADWLSLPVANLCAYAGVFAVPVLRREQGLAARWGRSVAFWAAASALYLLAYLQDWDFQARIAMNAVIHTLGTLWVVWHAWGLARLLDSLGVRMIAVSYLLYAAAQISRGLRVLWGYSDGVAISAEPDFLALSATALLAALCNNIGFMGMALDRARLKDSSQRQTLEQLREQQLALELAARERDAVRHERYRSSQVLAHEVRQPLHNAAVSLQAAVAALDGRHDAGDAVHALTQAQGVIRRVTASLDNTVALASLLTSDRRAPRHEVELDMLIALCVADLPPDARARVQVEHLADARSARLEPGLMRLALRNLLINATLYAPPGTPVSLRVLDSEDPLGLAIEVADQGPGLPPDVQGGLQDPQAAPGPSVAPGHGLGLQIVRRVAAMHDGRLDWRPNTPQGSVFRLLLPQAMPD